MRYTLRPITFVLTLSLGTAAWYTLAYRSVAGVGPAQPSITTAIKASTPTPTPEPQPAKLMRFGDIEQLLGFTNMETLVLRRKPDASASAVARVKLPINTLVDILGATRDFIHVKYPASVGTENAEEGKAEYEGWATWGAVEPVMTALVLDTQTGALLSRVPLSEEDTMVAYSPDGSRALFYGTQNYSGGTLGYEVNTSDYTLTRSLLAADAPVLGPVFYSPVDGALAALGKASIDDQKHLSLMRLGDFYTVDMPTKISAAATAFVVAADGRTGFVIHSQNNEQAEAAVDVVDLQSLEIRRTLSISGSQIYWQNGFVVSHDGSEIYLNREGADSVSVLIRGRARPCASCRRNSPGTIGSILLKATSSAILCSSGTGKRTMTKCTRMRAQHGSARPGRWSPTVRLRAWSKRATRPLPSTQKAHACSGWTSSITYRTGCR
jgi:hypothetical protein